MELDNEFRPTLPPIECPVCHQMLKARAGKVMPASSFESCLRRCDACGIGFSNAKRDPVTIVGTLAQAVPEAVYDGLSDALQAAVNAINRENKRAKFCFATSEDAITWTVFRRLHARARLAAALRAAEIIDASHDGEPAMLLWGAPIPAGHARAQLLASELANASARTGEDARKRTEPDVTLDFGPDGIVLIEVKHRSANEANASGSWTRYVCDGCFKDVKLAEQSGMYELARNWRFAYELAGTRQFAVVNLGPSRLFAGSSLDMFKRSLGATGRGRFVTMSWERLASVPDVRDDEVLTSFLADRGVCPI
jgi:hypothetical protein